LDSSDFVQVMTSHPYNKYISQHALKTFRRTGSLKELLFVYKE